MKTLKIFHLVFAGVWLGAGVTLAAGIASIGRSTSTDLHGIYVALKFVDDFIIIPAASGTLLTGILYSALTPWGWFKHRWITLKWAITIFGVVFGTFWMGPWVNSLVPLAERLGASAQEDTAFAHAHRMLLIWSPIQITSLIIAFVVSVLKPWRSRIAR